MANYEGQIRKIPFLANLSPAQASEVCAHVCPLTFSVGETVFSKTAPLGGILLLTSGKLAVYAADSQKDALLRILTDGDITGVATLFSNREPVSRAVALSTLHALLLSEETVKALLENDAAVMYRYISFLCDRIAFLNQKIATLTAGSAERRLAVFLDSLVPVGQDTATLPIPMNTLANYLNLGRASLYRAFDTLMADGFLEREGKQIRLRKREQMTLRYL